ncbi:MAG: PAS domain S-box protein, partial [Planctomycetes bacterium]|nr:PAS domain S-box protein [Planctomycetota bacterium]
MFPFLSTAAALLAWPQSPGVSTLERSGLPGWDYAGWLALAGFLVAALTLAYCVVRLRRHRSELRSLTTATEELAGLLTRPLSEREHGTFQRRGSAVERLREALERVSIALLQSRQAHRQLDAVLGSMTASVIVVEADGEHVRSINGAGRSLLGVEELDLRGAGLESLFGVETDVVRGLMQASAAGDGFGPRNLEVDLHSRDGRSSCVILSTAAVPDQEGRVEAFVVIAQEIGDLRRIEDRLHKINVRLWLTNELTAIALRIPDLEPAADQIAQALRDSECFRAAGLAILESDEDRLRLLRLAGFGDMQPEGARSLARSFLSTVLEHQEPILLHNQEGRFDFDDPLLGPVEASVFGVFPLVVASRRIGLLFLASQENQDGVEDFGHAGNDLARHIAPLIDQKLTNERLRHSNQELHEARVAAEEASRAKSDFLANMSHEIRTPMTAILGYADLVRDGGLAAADADEFVRTIRRNGEHLLSIINDILDISKIEAGMMTIERVPCSPVQIACDIVEMMGRRARDKGLDLELDLQWPLPRRVLSDPTRLRQVLSNLVGNAVKFTQSGKVRLSVKRAESGSERLVFEVRDTGIGLSGTELTRIFRPFSQADTSHTRRFGGTGLGLTISQRLANLLGGGISVQS